MSSVAEMSPKYILGLDLGSASLGWAMLAQDPFDALTHVIDAGVRIFEPGVDGTALDIEMGKDQSKAVERRTARLHRRQLRRRAARKRELFQLLQSHLLLPIPATGQGGSAEQRSHILTKFDQELEQTYGTAGGDAFSQMPLYHLRKKALYEALTPFELGRVFVHLSQRRGFFSNRQELKKGAEEKKEIGQVKSDINALEQAIKAADAQTLGEYFAGLDPHEVKVRRQWTGRAMFKKEFDLIWEAQSPFHREILSDDLRDRIAQLLFYQRKISKQEHLIGRCELEPKERRAPWAALPAQRFRMLQKINDLLIVDSQTQDARALDEEQRARLLQLLNDKGTQSFIALRKLPEFKGCFFNLELGAGKEGGEKNLPGNRTRASMLKVFGPQWDARGEQEQNAVVDQWRKSESDEQLRKEAAPWILDEVATESLIRETPAADYCSLSLKAIAKVLPFMEDGMAFKKAEIAAGYSRFANMKPHDLLPQVRKTLPTLRNPAVERAMTELRKVVNAIVRKYGKPNTIRVELARDLKKPRGERLKESDKGRSREKERLEAAKVVAADMGIDDKTLVNRRLIEKAMLHKECGGICPYTGKSIPLSSIWNDSPEFDIEHIIPRSRFPDNSFLNKTLCHQSFNQLKGNQTPFEMYKNDPEEYGQLLNRVRAWPIPNRAKLGRFRVGEPGLSEDNSIEGFSSRQLNDTRYTSVAAMKLLATLYGGTYVGPAGNTRQVVFATTGKITAALRSTWGLEEILRGLVPKQPGEDRGKPRTDHRHHAVDAITIAATQPSVIQKMATNFSQRYDPRLRPQVDPPWANFIPSIEPVIQQMLVSHRPEHKMSGALHDETNYSKPHMVNKKTVVHVRKRVAGLSEKDLPFIVDPAIREAVQLKAAALKGDLSGCDLKMDWPQLATRKGGSIHIKKVRMSKVLKVTAIGDGPTRRYVAESSNHHMAVYAQMDAHGKEKRWESVIVSLLEAAERSAASQRSEAYRQHHRLTPLVQRTLPVALDLQFKFSLMGGDTVETLLDYTQLGKTYKAGIYRVRTIAANGQISLLPITDARMKKEIKAAKEWWSPGADTLRKLGGRKVVVDLLGKVHPAND